MLTTPQWLLLASFFVPLLTVLAIVYTWRWYRGFHHERPPVSERLLRPAGESLRKELEKIDDQLNETLMWTVFGPAFITAFLMLTDAPAKTHFS